MAPKPTRAQEASGGFQGHGGIFGVVLFRARSWTEWSWWVLSSSGCPVILRKRDTELVTEGLFNMEDGK